MRGRVSSMLAHDHGYRASIDPHSPTTLEVRGHVEQQSEGGARVLKGKGCLLFLVSSHPTTAAVQIHFMSLSSCLSHP